MRISSLRAGSPTLPVRLLLATLFAFALTLGTLAAAPGAAHATDSTSAVRSADTTTSERTLTRRERIARRINAKVLNALEIIRNQQGDPYRYGAAGPDAFDCSGLMQYAFRRAGFEGIPRTSSAQAGWVRRISRDAMRPGDLVFFHSGGRVYHVGVYAGRLNGARTIIHSPNSGSRVHRAKIWTDSWFVGTKRR
jgi:cell wall-associated NlpC family hydrolase